MQQKSNDYQTIMEQSTHNQAQIIAAFYTVHQMEESKMYEQELQHCAVERVAEYHNTLRIVNLRMMLLAI